MTKEALTILISSAGRRVELIECFRKDAELLGMSLEVLATDLRPDLSAACQRADISFAAPPCTSAEFLPFVEDLIARRGVNLIVPTIDPELPVYSAAAERLARRGALVSVPGPRAVDIARNKKLTVDVLRQGGINVPETIMLSEYLGQELDWPGPLILKPVEGSSSVGIVRTPTSQDIGRLADAGDRYVVQTLWEGVEYTVNMYFDRTGKLRCAVPHRRIETRGGEVSKGRTERVPTLQRIASRIERCIPDGRGAMCFQAIVTPAGEAAVFELNARFGGGYPLSHMAGGRFTKWLLEETAGRAPSVPEEWSEGVTMLRYDAAVFLSE